MKQSHVLLILAAVVVFVFMAKGKGAKQSGVISQASLWGGTWNWLPWQPTPNQDNADAFNVATEAYNKLLESTGKVTTYKAETTAK